MSQTLDIRQRPAALPAGSADTSRRTRVRYWVLLMIFMAEAPAFPANAKVVASWFPAQERHMSILQAGWMIVAIMALAFFGKGFGAFGWAVMADVAPKEVIGLAGSIFNTCGAVAGIVTPIVIGYILSATGSFAGALVFVGLNALVTVFAYLVIVKDIKRIELRHE